MQDSVRPISRGEANKAGKALAQAYVAHGGDLARVGEDEEIQEYFRLVQAWRAMQIEPTRTVFEELQQISTLIPHSLVTFRLKRISSILKKLSRKNTNLKLGSMDDIGGCRLIVETCEQVDLVVEEVRRRLDVKKSRGVKDYIACPQDSGYRSCHIIVVVPGEPLPSRVEIQIRTRLQHSWATGVEAASAIYGQDYKSPEKLAGSRASYEDIRRFFQLASALFALEEDRPLASNVPNGREALKRELDALKCSKQICGDLVDATDATFQSIGKAFGALGPNLYLLEYDREEQVLYASPFSSSDISQAIDWYNQNEEEDVFSGRRDTVLVYATSTEYLHAAFPNYSTNLSDFIDNLGRCRQA
ncbi:MULTISPECIES: RelA/SpoT domain-containing protein [Actinotignum]|uniref:RelA/SpoT domain-containing protein n=2 Tax=Actinomycetaceae TaxID=2049 RepID=UPI000B359E33|nr:RelA/SpoT domain-containing protein [Actinotignum timonense]MDY5157651.1 RelA/SpoT domain-containing protein [Actinotignum timonense]